MIRLLKSIYSLCKRCAEYDANCKRVECVTNKPLTVTDHIIAVIATHTPYNVVVLTDVYDRTCSIDDLLQAVGIATATGCDLFFASDEARRRKGPGMN